MATTASYRNFTGSAAELYQSFFVPRIATPVSARLLDVAALRPGERVLDVACGTGVVTRAAAELVGPTGSVTGVDLAPDMLEIARQTPAAGAPISWQHADATELPLPDAHYDVGLCQMGLQFVDDRARAVSELHRVVASGGRVAINTPGRIQPRFEAIERAIVDHIDPGLGAFVGAVFSMHDPNAVADLLDRAGFVDVGSEEYVATLGLPGPAEFLWTYINLTPLAPLVAQAPPEARDAVERDVVEAWGGSSAGGDTIQEQPMALAWARRA